MTSDSLKNQRQKHNGNEEALQNSSNSCPFESLTQDIIFAILDSLALTHDSLSLKSFSLTSKSFYYLESLHRKSLKPLRSQLLPRILRRYSSISRLDLTLCPRVDDHTLSSISSLCKSRLRSIDLSRSRFFTSSGLSYLVTNCSFLVEIDLSNATTLTDSAAAVIAEAKNLERLWLVRCKLISEIGIGCVAVGCRKLRLLSLKWCCRVSDLGVGLIAMKCEDLRSLDLSYLPITEKCLSSILRLQSLEDLVLVACVGLDDDGLRTLKHGCRSLERLDVSNCQSIGHLGLSSFTEGSTCLRLLVLSYGCSVTAVAAKCLQNFSLLQSIKLDGCLVTCCGMKAIGNWCASLVELSLSKCSGVTDVGLCSIVETQKELKKLDITCCRWISYISIDGNTRSCTSLTSLRMESCTQVSKEAFVLIGKCCPFLEELDVTDNEIDDEGLKSISSCSKLCSLKVGICLNVTDQGLISIGMSCSELAELDLYSSSRLSQAASD